MSGQATTSNPGTGWGQFSLRALMVSVTAFCVLCALIAVPPLLALTCGVMYVMLTGGLAITIWLGRGWIQAFSVGAILPHLGGYLMALNIRGPIEFVIAEVVLTLLAALAGTGSAALHGFLARRQGMVPVPNLPLILFRKPPAPLVRIDKALPFLCEPNALASGAARKAYRKNPWLAPSAHVLGPI